MNKQKQEVFRYFRSHEFKRAVSMTALMLISGITLYQFNLSSCILGICVGILLTSFSDIQGSFRHRSFAMLLSILVSGLIMYIANVLHFSLPILLLFIGLASFIIAMCSVFGQRGSFFAFGGLLAIVLSLIEVKKGIAAVHHSLLIMAGGLLYFVFSTVYHLITRKNQTNEQLGELAKLTSDYLQLRLNYSKFNQSKPENKKLFDLQIAITEKQEELRTLILSDRKIKGISSTRNRQMLLLIELIDLMELAVANPQNLLNICESELVEEHIAEPFQAIAESIANRMQTIATQLREYQKQSLNSQQIDYSQAKESIAKFVAQVGLPQAREIALQMHNLIDYFQVQEEKLIAMERLISNVTRQRKLALSQQQQGQFLKKEDYDFAQIKDNLTFKSSIFRHALRVAIAMAGGYALALLLPIEKPYWVLLTVIVIMRPSYGLTKTRSLNRVIGTVIGVLLSIGLIQLSNSIVYFVSIAAFSMIFAFSLLQRNYILSSVAVTLSVVFVFSLIESNVYNVIKFRLIDTLLGAAVSLLIYYFILPYWEYRTFRETLLLSIQKNQEFLQEILKLNASETKDETNYRLKRKEAFVASSDLNASFQRFSADPKSKQNRYQQFYELVVTNQSTLSTLTNLGNFMKKHDLNALQSIIQEIGAEINQNFQSILSKEEKLDSYKAQEKLDSYWTTLENKRDEEIDRGKTSIEPSFRQELQEAQLIRQELNWLNNLTKSMKEKVDF